MKTFIKRLLLRLALTKEEQVMIDILISNNTKGYRYVGFDLKDLLPIQTLLTYTEKR